MRLKYYLRGLGIGIAVTAVILSFSGNDKAPAMTDEQIMARAEELGMQKAVEEETEDPEAVSEAETDALNEAGGQVDSAAEVQDKAEAEAPVEKTEEPESEDLEEQSDVSTAENAESDAQEADVPEQSAEAPATETESIEKPEKADSGDTEDTKTDATGSESGQQDKLPAVEQKADGESVEKMVLVTIKSGDSSVAVSRKVAEAGLAESAAEYDAYLCQNGYDKKLAVGVHEIPADATDEEIARILTSRKK